jgi:hypothetical protein
VAEGRDSGPRLRRGHTRPWEVAGGHPEGRREPAQLADRRQRLVEKLLTPPGCEFAPPLAVGNRGGSGLSRRLPREACWRVGLASAPDRDDPGLAFAPSSRGLWRLRSRSRRSCARALSRFACCQRRLSEVDRCIDPPNETGELPWAEIDPDVVRDPPPATRPRRLCPWRAPGAGRGEGGRIGMTSPRFRGGGEPAESRPAPRVLGRTVGLVGPR